jgi:alpha-D-ribose 1-methylphosphonate 5-phosphate C-P lyase
MTHSNLDDCPALHSSAPGARNAPMRSRPVRVPLDFEDHPFERTKFDSASALRRDRLVSR